MNTISAYADCHSMKLLNRFSPDERSTMSTSGSSGTYSARASAFSSIFAGSISPAAALARAAAAGRLNPDRIDEKAFAKALYVPELPDVDMVLRSSGENRFSNFMLWQSAYAEMVFMDVLWPDVDRRTLFEAIDIYARRDRRYGTA